MTLLVFHLKKLVIESLGTSYLIPVEYNKLIKVIQLFKDPI